MHPTAEKDRKRELLYKNPNISTVFFLKPHVTKESFAVTVALYMYK